MSRSESALSLRSICISHLRDVFMGIPGRLLDVSSSRPFGEVGIQIEFHVGIGEDDGTRIPSFDHDSTIFAHSRCICVR